MVLQPQVIEILNTPGNNPDHDLVLPSTADVIQKKLFRNVAIPLEKTVANFQEHWKKILIPVTKSLVLLNG